VEYNNLKFTQSWIVFFVIVTFLSYLLNLIFTFPVGIMLGLLGVPTKTTFWITKAGTFLSMLAVSWFFYKWSFKTFIIPQIENEQPNTNDLKDNYFNEGKFRL